MTIVLILPLEDSFDNISIVMQHNSNGVQYNDTTEMILQRLFCIIWKLQIPKNSQIFLILEFRK